MRGLAMIAAWGFSLATLHARQATVGQWKNYTDMKSIRGAVFLNGSVWAATGGGLFRYDVGRDLFVKFTNSEGLSSNDLRAVSADPASRIWVGASDGSLDVYDPAVDRWRTIVDIRQSIRVQRGVQSFFPKGDSMLVVTEFGVSVFIRSRWEFGDTYANFGFSSQPLVTRVVLQGNRIWVGTNQGVATALLSSPNLSSPTSWTTYSSGLPSLSVSALTVFHDTLVVGTSSGAAYYSANTFQTVNALNGKSIVDFQVSGNQLNVLWNGGGGFSLEAVQSLNNSSQLLVSNGTYSASSLVTNAPASETWVGTQSRGLARWNGATWSYKFPDGPQSNLFTNLAVDPDGILWVATGSSGGQGFYRFNPALREGGQWRNFTVATYPVIGSDDYHRIAIGPGGSVWVGSWGRGAVEVRADTVRRRLHTTSTPSFASSDGGDPAYPVIGGMGADLQGQMWFINRTAVNSNYLVRLMNDTAFAYYRNSINLSDGFFNNIVVDREGTKWIATEPSSPFSRGLYFFNENGTVAGTTATGGWGFMSTSDGLPNSIVRSIAVDFDGDVWVGTDLGVTIITDPRFPQTQRSSSFPLREQSVQTIAVDALNNKWIGTKEGVFVVSPDGTQLLQQYNVLSTNGQLVDNDVRSIAIDQKRGIVYCGTEKGLSSLQIAAVQTNRGYTTLEFGPNPFTLPNDQQLEIRNLVASSTIKILTVGGALVAQFKAQGGGRAFWDGKDQDGKFASSGVYFIVAFADNGNQLSSGKIAVIRK